jgi:hypothetical protein
VSSAKFIRERHLVTLLMQRLGEGPGAYDDPNARTGRETGADVLAYLHGRRIGVQVTELDTGDTPGTARAGEKKDARDGQHRHGGVYGGWAQNDPGKVVAAVQAAVARKVAISQRHDFRDFDEVWLLVSCGVPDLGAVISTFVMTPWLHADALNAATAGNLAGSKYARAFVHPVLGPEDALYHWTAGTGWRKETRLVDSRTKGPSVWDILAAARRG